MVVEQPDFNVTFLLWNFLQPMLGMYTLASASLFPTLECFVSYSWMLHILTVFLHSLLNFFLTHWFNQNYARETFRLMKGWPCMIRLEWNPVATSVCGAESRSYSRLTSLQAVIELLLKWLWCRQWRSLCGTSIIFFPLKHMGPVSSSL